MGLDFFSFGVFACLFVCLCIYAFVYLCIYVFVYLCICVCLFMGVVFLT
jgi:hypothetical protein